MGAPVELWVYDISNGMAKELLGGVLDKDIQGIWHSSIVVYGKEYYFFSGIKQSVPETTHFGTPVKKLPFGDTSVTEESFAAFLKEKDSLFTDQTYDIFENNCNHFTDTALMFLVQQNIPSYINELSLLLQSTPIGAMLKTLMDPPKSPSGSS
ncbi:desumoylating isopeptidase 1 [Nematocida sp. AWRm77]|nr:desumoylating isopeptidase 1 [Nematocida sp. AWRm77]